MQNSEAVSYCNTRGNNKGKRIVKRTNGIKHPPKLLVVDLAKHERKVFDEVVEHLNQAGAGMDIDLRMICAYAKEVFILDDLQEQMKEAIASKTDEGAQAVKRLNTALSGCNQRIFQAQQSLGIGSLNRRKISHFQDDLSSLQEEAANRDPLGALLG